MSSKLSDLINNLSKIYCKECRGCKERKKIKLVCNLIGLKNNKLNYKCKECKKSWLTPISGLIKSFQIHTNFVMMILTSLFCY